ncbi:MAG: mechanosensitive ion channel domain-containing protein [bacterium]
MIENSELLSPFQWIDYVVLGINLLIFLFAGAIVKVLNKAKGKSSNKAFGLRLFNLALFSIYVIAVGYKFYSGDQISHLQQISQTGLTILISYIILQYADWQVIQRFGKEREIDGKKYRTESYSSEVMGLMALLFISAISFLIIINIWNLNSWLQATSVLGGALLLLFAAKDYFLGDLISGLMMHYNESIEAGSVIKVPELQIHGVVLQITLSQVVIRDLQTRSEIALPNSRLRNAVVETLSNSGNRGVREFVDFFISYDVPGQQVTDFLEQVLALAAEKEMGINPDTKAKVTVVDNGDHAVCWRLLYFVKNPYRTIEAKNAVKTAAFELSQELNVGLNTPITYKLVE